MRIKNVRFIIAAITTLSAYAVYVSRVNLSIAIIAMVDDGHNGQHNVGGGESSGSAKLSSSNNNQTAAAAAGTTLVDPLLSANNNNAVGGNGNFTNRITKRNALDTTKPLLTVMSNESNSTLQINNQMQNSTSNTAAAAGAADQLHHAPLSTIFPASKQSVKTPLISQEKFRWDQREQGHILGAFFYGYILFQIPGARMAEQIGAKWILLAATAGSALISLLFPLSTQLNSIHLLMALRFVMGLCQSAFFPAAYVLFCRWLPEKERAILLPIMFIGSNMGSISTYIMSSYLITSSHGWPSVFYVSGFVCTLVTIFWCIFGSNGPENNWLITEEERQYIEGNVNNQSSGSNSLAELTTVEQQQQQKLSRKEGKSTKLTVIQEGYLTTATTNNLIPNNLQKNQLKLDENNNDNNNNNNNLLMLKKSASCCGEFTSSATAAAVENERNRNRNQNQDAKYQRLASLINNTNEKRVKEEKQQVEILISNNNNNNNELCWSKLLKSIPVWTLILSMYGNEWSNVVLCFELPTYLNTALNFPIEQNGVINSFFQLSYTLASPVMSSLGAYMLDRHILGMRKIHVRKLFQSLATFGQLICFVSVPICGANRGLIIMFMFSAIVFKACANAGDIMVPGDLSPEYAGTIFAFANSIGNTAGFFVPSLAGAFVQNAYEREQWTPFWLTTAAIMGSSGLIFLFLGETRRQDFSPDHSDKVISSSSLAISKNNISNGNVDQDMEETKQLNRRIKSQI